MNDETYKELDRMCRNIADLAVDEVQGQLEFPDDERAAWSNDHDLKVARSLVDNAARMYRLLTQVTAGSIPGKGNAIIEGVLLDAAPDMNALPNLGQCERCDADLTSSDMLVKKCHNCGTSLEE